MTNPFALPFSVPELVAVCVGRHQSAALRRAVYRAGWSERPKRQMPLLPSLTQRSIR